MQVSSGSNPRVEHPKGSLGQAQALPQKIDSAGKAYQGQTHWLITKIR